MAKNKEQAEEKAEDRQKKAKRPQEVAAGERPAHLRASVYRKELAKLQVELFQLQEWVQRENRRLIVVLEGLGPAGRRSTTQRIAEGLHRRIAHVVSAGQPSPKEKAEWPFQRFVEQFPAAGHILILDGSWYHEPAFQRALGWITETEFEPFLQSCAEFEQMLTHTGMTLVKFWFAASDEEQERRFQSHVADLAKEKEIDLSRAHVAEPLSCAEVRDVVLACTDRELAPWYLVRADDRRAARLNTLKYLVGLPKREDEKPEAAPESSNEDSGEAARTSPRYVPEGF